MEKGFQKRVYKTSHLEEISYLDTEESVSKCFSGLQLLCYEETLLKSGGKIVIRRNGRTYWAFHFVQSGTVELHCGERFFKLRPGNVFFNRGEEKVVLRVPDGCHFRKQTLLILYSNTLESLCGPFSEIESDLFFLKRSERVKKYLAAVAALLRNGHEFLRKELSILVYGCLLELGQEGIPSAKEMAVALTESIRRNPARFANIAYLAREAGMSRRSLFRFFHSRYGCTPMQYVIHARLEKSRWYLNCYMGMPIAEIARLCGYKSAGFYCREFKRHYGFTPNDYRLEHLDTNLSVN